MNKLYKKYKGFQKHYRFRHLISRYLFLSDAEYRLWDFMTTTAGWDDRYIDSYQIVEATLEHISEHLIWSKSKTSRTMKKLVGKGIVSRDRYLGYVVNLKAERGSEDNDKKTLSLMGINVAELEKYFLPAVKKVPREGQKQGYSDDSSLMSTNGNLISPSNMDIDMEDEEWIR